MSMGTGYADIEHFKRRMYLQLLPTLHSLIVCCYYYALPTYQALSYSQSAPAAEVRTLIACNACLFVLLDCIKSNDPFFLK